jgi:hypothetical protein
MILLLPFRGVVMAIQIGGSVGRGADNQLQDVIAVKTRLDTPQHAGHETGLACDMRLPRKDGQSGGITFEAQVYDRNTARAQLKALRVQPLFKRAFFNDPALIQEGLCARATGHDNHIHFEVGAPAPAVS